MAETALVQYETEHGKVKLSPDVVRKYLVSGNASKVTHQEVKMFLELCKYGRLNPFMREAYLIKFGDDPATMVVGKEVFTKRAAKNELCAGWEAGIVVKNDDGKLENRDGTFKLANEELIGGWAKVYRKDWKVPATSIVTMTEYQRKKKDGTPMANWRTMPSTMIRKVALVQALREAFPEDFEGMYSPEEMPIDESKLNDSPVEVEITVEDPEPEPEPEKEVKKITTKQAKRMFAIANGDQDIVKEVIEAAGFEKTSDIPINVYEALCAEIEEKASKVNESNGLTPEERAEIEEELGQKEIFDE